MLLSRQFSRKKWNNIIIIACLIMISVLSVIYDKTAHPQLNPSQETIPLFDEALPLKQLEIGSAQFTQKKQGWHCSINVSNCKKWIETWQNLRVIPLSTAPKLNEQAQEVVFYIEGFQAPQVWQLFAKQHILKSPQSNWYQMPDMPNKQLLPKMNGSKF
ncbi:hypothetical protein [uncultured Shewanella sp.]|uniref:hypothetical protein n=1 Tax=uncultured Shewanella sp. TaxID=173975 RepID=UPI00260676A6|nr:hypothetical protein [uncultured Shewanella sp.]